jgi:hypothetical protein
MFIVVVEPMDKGIESPGLIVLPSATTLRDVALKVIVS